MYRDVRHLIAVHPSISLPLFARYRSSTAPVVRCSTSSHGSDSPVHVPVLLHEVITAFSRNVVTDTSGPRYFVDGTTGFGGHARGILEHFPAAKLLCVDRDPEVLGIARSNLDEFHGRVSFVTGSYTDLDMHLKAAGFPKEVNGILLDLGANSFHFDAARRGFSVLNDGPLDMRFNQQDTRLQTAADAVKTLSEVQLTKIFRCLGEERLAKEYAKAIVRERDERGKVFETTKELRECIERIANMWKPLNKKKKNGKLTNKSRMIHPATRCFQALRIYVNDELNHVESGVKQLVNHLAPNGRLLTIAFHSLEDRPIKEFFRELDEQSRMEVDEEWTDTGRKDQAEDGPCLRKKHFCLTRRKATKATAEEVATNSRSRSARLRCLERIR